jgi:hypothetical protein
MKSGEVALTENGIPEEFTSAQTKQSTTAEDQTKIEDSIYKIALEIINQLNFDAELKIETEFKNIGTIKTIEMPTDYIKESELNK